MTYGGCTLQYLIVKLGSEKNNTKVKSNIFMEL